MVRRTSNPSEVIRFGIVGELHSAALPYDRQQARTGSCVEGVGADAETAWLPPEVALDPKGCVLTGSDVRAAGRWYLDRGPALLETSAPGHLRLR
jgi:hypothetical protein